MQSSKQINQPIQRQSSTESECKLSRRSIDWRDSGIFIDTDSECSSKRSSLDVIEDFQFDTLSKVELTGDKLTGPPSQSKEISILESLTNSNYFSGEDIDFTYERKTIPPSIEDLMRLQDEDGDTILHLAIIGCSDAILEDLVQVYRHRDTLDVMNNMLHTPLHLATMIQRDNAVQSLIQNGATHNMIDRKGNTCLHIACQNGHLSTVDTILETIAQIYKVPSLEIPIVCKNLIVMSNFDGHNCVHLAARNGHNAIVERLATVYQSDLSIRDGKCGETALHVAIRHLDVNLVTLILNEQGKTTCNQPSLCGARPLKMIKRMLMTECNEDKALKLTRLELLIKQAQSNAFGYDETDESDESDFDVQDYTSSESSEDEED